MAAVARPLRIGLTGGIGSGKSTVAACWVELGATLSDADAIARTLTAAGGAAMPALREAFGAAVLREDGALDRDAMRSLAFADAAVRQTLESILHPMIAAEAERIADRAAHCVVFDIPLLAESRYWRARVDRVLVVDCDVCTQVERVVLRAGWTREQAEKVIATQAPRAARRAVADAIIHNQGIDPSGLAAEVRTLWSLWMPAPRIAVEQ